MNASSKVSVRWAAAMCRLSAGRDIDNLSAVIPSIGKQVGGTTPAR